LQWIKDSGSGHVVVGRKAHSNLFFSPQKASGSIDMKELRYVLSDAALGTSSFSSPSAAAAAAAEDDGGGGDDIEEEDDDVKDGDTGDDDAVKDGDDDGGDDDDADDVSICCFYGSPNGHASHHSIV